MSGKAAAEREKQLEAACRKYEVSLAELGAMPHRRVAAMLGVKSVNDMALAVIAEGVRSYLVKWGFQS